MTEEQIDLMYEHYLLDRAPRDNADGKLRDPDYDKEEVNNEVYPEGYSAEQAKAEGRLPLQDYEHFEDPNFEEEWNRIEEEELSDINNVGENLPNGQFEEVEGDEFVNMSSDIQMDGDEWEEV